MMEFKKIPNILIIDTGYLSADNATGITLRSIWQDWPEDKIMCICVNPNQAIEKKTRYSNCIHIINRQYIIGAQISWCLKRKFTGLQSDPSINSNSLSNNKTRWGSVVELAKALVDSLPIVLDKETKNIISEFKPDVIYTLGGSIRVLSYALDVSEFCNRKILVHFMDGYLDVQYKVYKITYIFNYLLKKYLKKCLLRSSAILCISEKMATEYRTFFNLPTYTLMNCACDENGHEYMKQEPLTFVYAGGLHLGRWDTIDKLCKAVSHINREKIRVVFNLYIPLTEVKNKKELAISYIGVNVFEAKAHEEILKIYKSADALVFVESFEERIRKFTRLSFSTKLPEYMAARKPIVCYAPDELATSQYIRVHKIGICIGDNDDPGNCIEKGLFNYESRMTMANNAFNRYRQDFSPEQVKKKLHLALEANIIKISAKDK